MKKKWNGSEHLICSHCGYVQEDIGTVLQYKVRHPGVPSDDIPYVCDECKSKEE